MLSLFADDAVLTVGGKTYTGKDQDQELLAGRRHLPTAKPVGGLYAGLPHSLRCGRRPCAPLFRMPLCRQGSEQDRRAHQLGGYPRAGQWPLAYQGDEGSSRAGALTVAPGAEIDCAHTFISRLSSSRNRQSVLSAMSLLRLRSGRSGWVGPWPSGPSWFRERPPRPAPAARGRRGVPRERMVPAKGFWFAPAAGNDIQPRALRPPLGAPRPCHLGVK